MDNGAGMKIVHPPMCFLTGLVIMLFVVGLREYQMVFALRDGDDLKGIWR